MNSSVRLYYPSEKEAEQPQCKSTPPQPPVPGGIEPTICRRCRAAMTRSESPISLPRICVSQAGPVARCRTKTPCRGASAGEGVFPRPMLIGLAAQLARSFETEGRGSVLAEPRPSVDSSQR